MKKTNSLLSLLMIIYAVSSAQMTNTTDANIVGHVIDAATKKHIHYVTIAIKGTTIGTLSDASGHYYLKNLPLGEYTLVASYVGYVSVEKKVELIKGKTIEVNFELEEDVLSLNNVVVSANRNATNRQEAPSVVNVISPKMFENVQSLCLADGLNYQSGLRVESNCQNCGFPQVRINGLEGPYSQILIDSRAISSALAGVYGLEQIPVNMIERVEVVRGGGSATFGSNAIAGTINIITKEPKINAVCLKNTTQLIGFNAIDVNNTLNASVVSNKNKAGVTLFAGARQRGAYDANEDGFSEIGKINNKNLGMRGYWHLNDHGKLTFEYHTIREFRRGGNLLHLPAHEADIAEQTEHDIHTAGITYDLFLDNRKHWLQLYASLQHIDRQSYYGSGKDLNAYGTTKDLANVDGIQYVLSMKKCLFMPATLTSGMEISYNSLLDKMLGYNRTIDQKALIYSVFLQNEWSNRKLSLLVGARMDKHNLIQHPIVSPRLNLRYAPHK
ncbi:MAG: carboxypeptidase-like regulatory domain-containing protein, partial [Bacteroidales bacterium]|nr:carboxypeptidase-like regulatory domain-containing protein [Bacteroidales bacterium]